ncbi:hypothetical protein JYU34_013215 [Plutella xylostella]|uniref:MD-2-related lipid-recognition domain-containing protein n=1 Tax=Plutella xylostella TaxID=51655 RepID=A0ABQ7Q9C1_PLUXY|nr:hypothetical protein JYU34_013215 [Plutella xylostella]
MYFTPVFCGLLALICHVAGEFTVVPTTPCSEASATQCLVGEVRIDPCRQAPRPCRLKRGTNTTISFEFTPSFSAATATQRVYWDKVSSPEFADLDHDACHYTGCGLEAGKTQTLLYPLYLAKKLPSGTYPIKWKVFNGDNVNEFCCFKTTIYLKP